MLRTEFDHLRAKVANEPRLKKSFGERRNVQGLINRLVSWLYRAAVNVVGSVHLKRRADSQEVVSGET